MLNILTFSLYAGIYFGRHFYRDIVFFILYVFILSLVRDANTQAIEHKQSQ